MIFFKKKHIVLDCFTSEAGLAEVFPIAPIINNMPSWHQDSNLIVPPGILEFKTQHSTHINIVSRKEEPNIEYRIKAGEPLAYLVPLTENTVKIKTHVVSQEEIRKMKNFHHSFYNSYEITKRILT